LHAAAVFQHAQHPHFAIRHGIRQNLSRSDGGDLRMPNLSIQNFGYLYLADTDEAAAQLR